MKIGDIDFGDFPVFLAPLEDITDLPYRLICREYGADLVYTEFVSSDALIRDVNRSVDKSRIEEKERPVAIQIFGHDEESMRLAAQKVAEAKPDLIDINWGCPVRKVVAKGAGSAILKDIPKMLRITKAVVDAVDLPVTVKTRLGWDHTHKPIVDVAEQLQDVGIKAISIHGRTRSQMYGGEADWELIKAVKQNPRMKIPVIGNGDVDSPQVAKMRFEHSGVDAIMIGRAAIGNPWLFAQVKNYLNNGILDTHVPVDDRLELCKRHLEAEIKHKGERAAVIEMRKLYAKYFKGIDHFKAFRMMLMEVEDKNDVWNIFEKIDRFYHQDEK